MYPKRQLQAVAIAFLAFSAQSLAQSVHPRPRITRPITGEVRTIGNRHPLARFEYDAGAVPGEQRMERMILALEPGAEQQAALDALVAEQHDPASPYYHQWLTPEQFGERFGVAAEDLSRVAGWLESQGMQVDELPAGRRSILFSGTAAQVEAAFHTRMRAYRVNGERHIANEIDPEIPETLSPVVRGVVSLHDFRTRPAHANVRALAAPQYSSGGGTHYMSPADFATIYNVAPLYESSVDGSGQSIAVVARSNFAASDIAAFRSKFGLSAKAPAVIVNGADPGVLGNDELTEAVLDVEWAGAVAKNADVQVVVSASTAASDGVFLSAAYIVNHNLAPVMTVSFGACENALGSTGNAMLNSLWQQAAAQGITVLVGSGDSGAADCDGMAASTASNGRGVNGMCSSPYSVCVGGTEFADDSNASAYWSAITNPATGASALQYVPEASWNQSGITAGGSGLYASGGGASAVYAKPSWQTGTGVPADGRRDVPDVSLNASTHDGYLIYRNGQLYAAGGTSAATPAFGGLIALAVQKNGARQGNANPALYRLAARQQAGGAAVFHDVVTGNNSVPGATGFNAGPGYDQVTGLGSVDANQLVNHWSDTGSQPAPGIQLSLSKDAVSSTPGQAATVSVTAGVSGGLNSTVSLATTGLPTGVAASFSPSAFGAPGSGVSTLTVLPGIQVAPGTYTFQVTATAGAGGVAQSTPIALTVTAAGGISVSVDPAALSIKQGASATSVVRVAVSGTFHAAVTLSLAGLPGGVTATPAPSTLPAPGSGSATIAWTASAQSTAGSYNVQVIATGGGITQTANVVLKIVALPGFSVILNPSALTLAPGTSRTANLGVTVTGGFNSALALAVTGMPGGMTATFSTASLAAPGNGQAILTVAAGPSVAPGTYALKISVAGGGINASLPMTVVVAAAKLTLTGSAPSVTLTQGGNASLMLTLAGAGGFNSAVALSVAGLPSGVTASFAPQTVPAPGAGQSILTLAAAGNAALASGQITITASGGGLTESMVVNVSVIAQPGFSFAVDATTLILPQGGSAGVNLTINEFGGMTAAIALSATGLPPGVTASFSPASVSGSGAHKSLLKLTAAPNASIISMPLTLTAAGGGLKSTITVVIRVVGASGGNRQARTLGR